MEAVAELKRFGVVLLRGLVSADTVQSLRSAAVACFEAIESSGTAPERYRFNRFSNSVLATALLDYRVSGVEDLIAPAVLAGMELVAPEILGCSAAWSREQSWVRKKHPPMPGRPAYYQPHSWHQDGALGVRFPLSPSPVGPMTLLVTCWLALDACGRDAPGLEFLRRPVEDLLHFTKLNDAELRRRVGAADLWVPELVAGDMLVFSNGTLHRTFETAAMTQSRLSIEYRWMAAPRG